MRSRLRVLAATVAVASGVVVAAPALPALASGGSVSGTVTLASGQPATNVCVKAQSWYSGTSATTSTATDGTYHLDLSDGTYRVSFSDCGGRDLVTGWWPQKLEVNEATTLTVAGSALTGVDEQMVQGGKLAGRILDGQGLPLSGVSVSLQAPADQAFGGLEQVVTDAQGHYTLVGVAPGSWRVSAQRSPDYPQTFSGDTDNYQAATLFQVTASATTTASDMHLRRAATIVGTVTDEYGNPRAGVCVSAWGSTESVQLAGVKTTADGTYTLTGLFPGQDRVSVSACQGPLVWYTDGDSYVHATAIDAGEGATVSGIDMVLPNGPVVSGTVTDIDGNPLPGVEIQLFDGISRGASSQYGTTDSDGHYLITGLQSKLYLVEADPEIGYPDLVHRYWPASPSRVAAVPVAATVATTGIDFVLPVGGSIAGQVTAAADGSPLGRVCVGALSTLPDQTRFATAAADGTYKIRGLDAGPYDLRFEDCNHIYNVASTFWQGSDLMGSGSQVTLSLGQDVTGVDQAMSGGGSMHGRVTDPDGNPLSHICVYAAGRDASISYGSAITDSTGAWTVSGLAGGRNFSLYFHACDSSAPWVPKTLPDDYTPTAGGDLAVPDVVLHRGGSFSGTVLDQFGHPVDQVCVESVPSDPGGTSVYFHTSVNGTYSAGGLEPGTYSAWFTDCGVGMIDTYWHSPTYATRGTFTVTSDHTTAGIDQAVVIYVLPTVPTDVTVSPADGAATLSWQPPASSGNTDITGYLVTGPTGTTTVDSSARSVHFTGLTNGSTYQLSVAAINRKGTGAARTVAARLLPVHAVTIAGPSAVRTGRAATLRGRVTLSDGSAADSRVVTFYRRPAGSTSGWQRFAHATTASDGRWQLAVTPARPMAYKAQVAGVSGRWVQRVSALLEAQHTSGRLTLATSPSRPHAVVVLQRRRYDGTWMTWRRTKLNSYGRVVVDVPRGRWRGVLPAAGYWAGSHSLVV